MNLFITSENAVKLCFPLYFPLLSKRPWNPYRALFLCTFSAINLADEIDSESYNNTSTTSVSPENEWPVSVIMPSSEDMPPSGYVRCADITEPGCDEPLISDEITNSAIGGFGGGLITGGIAKGAKAAAVAAGKYIFDKTTDPSQQYTPPSKYTNSPQYKNSPMDLLSNKKLEDIGSTCYNETSGSSGSSMLFRECVKNKGVKIRP